MDTDDYKYFDEDHSDENHNEEANDGDLKWLACLSRIILWLPHTALERGEGDWGEGNSIPAQISTFQSELQIAKEDGRGEHGLFWMVAW